MEDRPNKPEDMEGDPFFALPKVYSNTMRVSRTYYESQFIVGTAVINPLQKQTYQMIEPRFVILTSPQHFKVLTRIMQDQLDKYEKEFGEIPDPPEPPKKKQK